MSKTRVLSECERGQIVGYHKDRMSQRHIPQDELFSICNTNDSQMLQRNTTQKVGRQYKEQVEKKITSSRGDRFTFCQSIKSSRKASS